MTVVDVHSHYFPESLQPPSSTGPWPHLVVDDATRGRIVVGNRHFRDVRAPLWDMAARMAEMDSLGVERQLLSPVPVTLDVDAEPALVEEFVRRLNEGMATATTHSPDRFPALGAVPATSPGRAVEELHHAVRELGLVGVEIGCRFGDRELDAPEWRPFFRAADELGALVFVHPLGGGSGAIRRTGQPYDFGLGMLSDTAMAASALVFGGVLDECPELRVLLAHGCGTFGWALPRLSAGSVLGGDHSSGNHADLVRRLWVDTLVMDPSLLPLLVERFGADHVAVGSDYPFIPGQLEGIRGMVGASVAAGRLDDVTAQDVLRGNGSRLLDELGVCKPSGQR